MIKGSKHKKESLKKMSKKLKGKSAWNRGSTSEIDSRILKGEKHPMFNRHHTKESKKKSSESHKGKIPVNKGKTNEEMYGKEKAEQMRKKNGEANKKENISKEKWEKMEPSFFKVGQTAWNKGRTWEQLYGVEKAEEMSRKLSALRKDKYSGKNHPLYNKKPSKETRKKESVSHIGLLRGTNHPNWKGGISQLTKRIRCSFKYRQWRSDVFTRDDFTCQECGKRGCYLEAHHCEKSFSSIISKYKIDTLEKALECEELWDVNNGETRCKECHNKTKRGRCTKC